MFLFQSQSHVETLETRIYIDEGLHDLVNDVRMEG